MNRESLIFMLRINFKNTSENNYRFPYKRKYTQIHFYSQIGTFNKLCEWFEYLKENNAYDNTKIIIVSDHGRDIDDPFSQTFLIMKKKETNIHLSSSTSG